MFYGDTLKDMSENLRCFIAIDIPLNIKNEVALFQDKLKALNIDIKCVEEVNIHITLKFLGSISSDKVDLIKSAISKVAIRTSGFDAHIGNIGFFPSVTHPKVIWLDVNKNSQDILKIFNDLEDELAGIGFEKDSRPFRTHLTIARFRSLKNISSLGDFVNKNRFSSCADFKVDEIALYESTLTSKGPIYTKIFGANLKTI